MNGNEFSSDIVILISILKRIGNFNMKNFKNRLVFQKMVYFLEVFGFQLGYKFTWYLYGPYSPDLTKEGFKINEITKDVPEIKFVNDDYEYKLKKLLTFINQYKEDDHMLELLSSMHFLKHSIINPNKDVIKAFILNKQTKFTEDEFEKGWKYLERFDL